MDIVGISQKEQVFLLHEHEFSFFLSRNGKFILPVLTSPLPFPFFCKEAIFRVVAAILHIGNIEFAKGKEIDSSVPKDDKAKFHLETTAELLMYVCHCIVTLHTHMILNWL